MMDGLTSAYVPRGLSGDVKALSSLLWIPVGTRPWNAFSQVRKASIY